MGNSINKLENLGNNILNIDVINKEVLDNYKNKEVLDNDKNKEEKDEYLNNIKLIEKIVKNVVYEFVKKTILTYDSDKKNLYKLTEVEYYNIFVNYCYLLFELSYNNNYMSKKDFDYLNNFLNKPEFINLITENYNENIYYKTPDNIDKIYEKELKERNDLYTKNLKNDTSISEIIGNVEFENIMNELEDETQSFQVRCKTDVQCKKINSNLYCKDEICNHDKFEIGEKCKDDNDCYSNFCKESKNKKTNESVRYCRKKI